MPGPVSYITGQLARLLRRERVSIKAEDGEASPDTAVPAGARTRMTAVLPREMEGEYEWSSDSDRITLEDADQETVTIVAGDEISSRGGERINLRFRSDDGSFESRRHVSINVIKVEFEKAIDPVYGHDEMDNEEGEDHHLSIKKNDFGYAWVNITGGANGGVLRFTTEDSSVAEVEDTDAPARRGTHFLQVIRGRNTNKGETEIKVRTFRDDGPVAAVLKVNVYRNKSDTVTVAKVIDSESDDTALSRPDFDLWEAEEIINGWYCECVGEIVIDEETDEESETMDIRFDLNGNGALDLEPGTTSREERAIISEFNPAGQKIVIVKDLNWIYFLREAASAGDESINLKNSYSNVRGGSERGYMKFLVVGNSYTLGTGDSAEEITVNGRNGATVNLSGPLSNDHGTDEGIMWPLSGLSGNPIWVKEGSKTEDKVRQTIAHECGHSIFSWRDVDSSTSLMHYSSGRTDTLLRFKDQPKKYEEGDENQWDTVSR
ncbi:MAG: hypothetical protein GF417_06995 [Candidatus Latescibacteria bacterium]|nr:hypothetical protein [bacterium]MBD3424166.1 hypothetical protein [Candidatus Latescibacterota bacterium]